MIVEYIMDCDWQIKKMANRRYLKIRQLFTLLTYIQVKQIGSIYQLQNSK